LPCRHHAERHRQHVLGADARLVGQRDQVAINAQVRIIADFQVQVGSAPLHGDCQQIINIHAKASPGKQFVS